MSHGVTLAGLMNLGYSKGETIAAVGGAEPPVRLDFLEDRGDQWHLVLRYAGRSYRLSWQLESLTLRWLDDTIPMSSTWLAQWISGLLEEMSVGLPYGRLTPLEQKLLDAVVASTLTFREYPIRDIGLRAAIGRPMQADYEAAVLRLSSRYLRTFSPVRCFEASLAGLLTSSEAEFVRQILDAALACLGERYRVDPEFTSFTLDEVIRHGNFEETARHSVYRVIELTRLHEGGGGSVTATSATFQWATPRDIEHIAECHNTDAFLEYVRNDEKCRTECTAPFRLPQERTITPPPPQRLLPTGRWLGRTNAPCVVVLLPRGLVLIDNIEYSASSSWAVTLNYLSYQMDKREGGTHFHSSYKKSWLDRPETQYAKLGIPPGDHIYALHVLELAMDFRDRRPDEPSRHILERDSHDVRLLEGSADLFAAELDSADIQAGECRDLALGFEKLAEGSWDVRTAEATFLRAASLAARALGPAHFVTDRLQQLGNFPPEAPRRDNALAASALMWSLSEDLVDLRPTATNVIASGNSPTPSQITSESTIMSTPTSARTGIFFSHATKDRDVTNAFIEKILILGMGIDRDSIFNVSDVDQGVRTGQYFVPYIRTMIQKSAVVLAWITPRYVESSFCMCELGAAWALCDDAVPFLPLIDDLGYNQLPGVLHGMQVLNASEGQVLDKFSNELAQLLGIQGKQKAATWNRHKADFYASYPALKASNPATPAKPNSKTPILKRVKALVTSLRESENKKSTMPMISPAQAAQFNALLEEAKQIGVDTKIQPFPAKPGGAGVHFGMTATPFSDLIASLVMLAADLED